MAQKEVEFQKMIAKKTGVPSFVIPRKPMPKPPTPCAPIPSRTVIPRPPSRSRPPSERPSTPQGWGAAPAPPRPASQGVSFALALIQKFPRVSII